MSAEQAHDVTDSPLSDQQLAALPVAYGTAVGMRERAGITEGETVVVTGASGGVGLALVQLAAARGAKVIAVTSARKAADVSAAGASPTVDRTAEDLAQQIGRHSPGGLDAVADVAGGPLIARLMPLIRDDGRWVIAGAVAGPVVDVGLRRLYLHNISLIGSAMHTRGHFATLLEAVRSGAVQPVIAARYALDDIATAQGHFTRGQHVGKLVLDVARPTRRVADPLSGDSQGECEAGPTWCGPGTPTCDPGPPLAGRGPYEGAAGSTMAASLGEPTAPPSV